MKNLNLKKIDSDKKFYIPEMMYKPIKVLVSFNYESSSGYSQEERDLAEKLFTDIPLREGLLEVGKSHSTVEVGDRFFNSIYFLFWE